MAVQLKPLDQLDSDRVVALLDTFSQHVQEQAPSIQASRGVFRSVLTYFHALGSAQLEDLVDQYKSARSVATLLQDSSADPDLVDAALSNFGVTRVQGQKAKGQVSILLSSNTSVVMAKGSVIESQGLRFFLTETFTGKADGDFVTLSTDRYLSPLTNGMYEFLVDVEAEFAGSNYSLAKGAPMQPVNPPSAYVSASVYSDFVGGSDTETNAQLLARLQEGLSCRSLCTRAGMSSLLKSLPQFQSVVRDSAVGIGYPEMRRNRHSVFPVAIPGYVDWYVRTAVVPQIFTRSVEAVAQGTMSDGYPVYRAVVPASKCNGFYYVSRVAPGASPDKPAIVLTQTRGFELSGTRPPDIRTAEEAAFSSYSNVTLTFADTSTLTTVAEGTKKTFYVDFFGLPLISELQKYVNSEDIAMLGGDCLVRAPVPCVVRPAVEITRSSVLDGVVTVDVQAAAAQAINQVGWTGKVFGSAVATAINAVLPKGAAVSKLDMVGFLYAPDGSIGGVRGTDRLQITEDPSKGISARTVQFFCSADQVGVTIYTDSTL